MVVLGLIMVGTALIVNFMMQDSEGKSAISFGLAFLGIAGFILAVNAVESSKYKEGQLDCMNGNIKYELHIEQDSTYKYIGD